MNLFSVFGVKRAAWLAVFAVVCATGSAMSGEVTNGTDNATSPREGSLRAVAAAVNPNETITIDSNVVEVSLAGDKPVEIGQNSVTIAGNVIGAGPAARLADMVKYAADNPKNTAQLTTIARTMDRMAESSLTMLTASRAATSPLIAAVPGTTHLELQNFYIHSVRSSTLQGLISAYEDTAMGNDVALGDMTNVVFSGNSVDASINGFGGGMVGARNLNLNRSATIGNFRNAFFYNNTINYTGTGSEANFTGGGIVGAMANSTSGTNSIAIGGFDNTVFSLNKVAISGNIEGGGLVGARSGGHADNLSIGAIRGSLFFDNRVTSGGDIWGGGLVGVYTTQCSSRIGMGGLYDTVFIGNQVTARNTVHGALISGGVISSGGYVISNTQFIDNTITSERGSVYGGALAINTNYTGGGTHKLTLTATDGKKTVFSGNRVIEGSNTRYNSIYMGEIGRNSPGHGRIEVAPETGGSVELYDPIRVYMPNSGVRFDMTVGGGGRFVWGGKNSIEANGGSTVDFLANSNSTLASDFQLIANNKTLAVNLAGGATIAFDAARDPDAAIFSFDSSSPHAFTIQSGAILTASKRVGVDTDYKLVSGDNALISSIQDGNLTLGGNLSAVSKLGGDLWVTLQASDSEVLNWNGSLSGDWDFETENWTGVYQTFANGDKAIFGSGATRKSVAVRSAGVIVADMDVTENGYVFTGGAITGSTTDSNGAVVIPTGKLTIADGVSATFGNQLAFAGGITVGAGGELALNYATAVTDSNAIAGAGALRKTGPGVLTLATPNTYAGGTVIDGGTLRATHGGAVGSGGVTVNAPGVFDMGFAGDNIFSQNIAGTGSIRHSGGDRLVLTGANSHTGETRVTAGSLVIGQESALSATSGVVVSGGASLVIDNAAAMNFSRPLSGDGGLVKDGAGTLTLSGANSHAGGSEIAAGSVVLGHDAALGVLAASGDAGRVRFTGDNTGIIADGVRAVRNAFEVDANLTGASFVANADLTVNTTAGRDALTLGANSSTALAANGGNIFLNGGVAGSGSIAKTGAGAVQVAATSAFGGDTTVSGGAFRIAANAVYGNGAAGSAFTVNGGATLAGNGTIHAETITVYGILSADSVTAASASDLASLDGSLGTLTLGGANTNSVTLDGATLRIDLAGQNRSDRIVVGQGIGFGATNQVDIGAFAKGKFTIMTATGMTAADLSHFNSTVTLNGAAITGRMTASIGIEGDNLVLTAAVDNQNMTWTNDAGTGVWDYTDANWSGHPSNSFAAGDYAIFTGSPAGPVRVGAAGVQTSGMSVTGDYTFSGGAITGVVGSIGGVATDGKLRVNGTVVFTNNSNNFAGGIEIDGGSVAFNRSNQLGDGGKGIRVNANAALKPNAANLTLGNAFTIASGATMTVDTTNGDNLTLAGALAGNGGLAKSGSGALNLTAANSGYTGAITVSSGVLRLRNAGGLGSGGVSLASGAALEIANAAALANAISGQGGVRKTGTGAASLSGGNSYSGGTVVEEGKLTALSIASLGSDAEANRVAVSGTAELELSLAASQTAGLAKLFRRTSLAGDGVFTLAATEDIVLDQDLALASAAGGGVRLAAPGKTFTLDSMKLDLDDAYLAVTDGTTLRSVGAVGVAASEIRVDGGLDLAAGSAFSSDGSVIFNENATVAVATGGVLSTGGSLVFREGAAITIGATDETDIGRLHADKDVDFAGKTTVHFGEEADYYKGQAFITADGAIEHFENLHSDFYALVLEDGAVTIKGTFGFGEIQDNLFGPDGQSRNLVAGGRYVDDNRDLMTPELQKQLDDFVKRLDDADLRLDTAHAALRQLYGEYAAYSGTAHRISSQRFTGAIKSWVNQKMTSERIADTLAMASVASGRAYASPYYGRGGYDDEYYGGGYREYEPRREYYYDEYGYDEVSGPAGRFWGGAFGAWAEQDSKARISGYDYDARGLMLGYDRRIGDSLLIGAAAAYSTGELKVGGLMSKYDADVAQAAVYANYRHESNLYATVTLAFGYGWNDAETRAVFGGVKKGDFHTRSYTANLEIGYVVELPADVNFVPAIGVEYTYMSRDGWREAASDDAIANWFEKRYDNLLDIPIGVRLNKVICLGNGGFIAPEIRANWIYTAGDKTPTVASGLVGSGATVGIEGVKPGDSRWQLGAGVKAQLSERLNASIDYNFEIRDKYREHNLSAEVGLSF